MPCVQNSKLKIEIYYYSISQQKGIVNRKFALSLHRAGDFGGILRIFYEK
jgi:hypothetical protein